ncbi:MAG: hypothetical protein ACXWEY_16535 [Bacteroidia bacterium]
MKQIFIFIIIAVILASCHKETPVQTSRIHLSYVYKVIKARNSNPLNIYYFYIAEAIDTATAKNFRVDLDSSNKATFTLPPGVNAVQKSKDSITVELKNNAFFGSAIMLSAANNGLLDKIEQSFYVNGKVPQNSDYEPDSLYVYKFKLTEYKKGLLMRTTDFGMYTRRLR